MTELQLYKFISENNIEWHRHNEDVLIMPYIYQLADFYNLLSPSIFDDDGIEIVLKDGYVTIPMKDICEFYDIDMNNVFEGSVAS